MKPRLWVLIAAAVLVAAFAFLLWDFVGDEGAARLERSRDEQQEGREASKPRRSAPAVESNLADQTGVAERADEPAIPTNGRRDVLRVGCRGAGGQPWTLHYLAFEDIDLATKTELLVVATDIRKLLLESGRTVELEAGQVAELSLATAGYYLLATAEGRQSPPLEANNLRDSYKPGHRLSLRLERVREVEVLVLDASGAPAEGVPLVERSRPSGSKGRGPRGVLSWALSDATGIARFTVPVGRVEGHVIELGAPCRKPPQVSMPAHGSTAVLRLPPTGSVEVEFVDAEGRVVAEELGVTLYPLDSERDDRIPFQWSRRVEAGVVRFDWLTLEDMSLGIGARPLDESREPSNENFVGPGASGVFVRIRARLGSPHPRIVGRLIDRDGRPFLRAGGQVGIAEMVGRSRTSWEPLRGLGKDGTFSQGLLWADGELSCEVVFSVLHAGGRRFGVDAPRGSVRLQQGLQYGLNDLGDVMCEAPPELVGGRLLNPDGSPASGLAVEFVPSAIPLQHVSFYKLNRLRSVTDDDGRFSFKGDPELQYRLRLAGREDFLTELLGPEPTYFEITLPAGD